MFICICPLVEFYTLQISLIDCSIICNQPAQRIVAKDVKITNLATLLLLFWRLFGEINVSYMKFAIAHNTCEKILANDSLALSMRGRFSQSSRNTCSQSFWSFRKIVFCLAARTSSYMNALISKSLAYMLDSV